MQQVSEEVKVQVRELYSAADAAGVRVKNHFEAFKLVVVCEGNTKEAIKRLRNIRECEEKFNLEEIDPMDAFDMMQKEFPGSLIGYTGYDMHGRLVYFSNMATFTPGKMASDPQVLRHGIRHLHDVFSASAVNLEEFDKGMVFIQNAKGIGWKNFSMKLEKEISWMYMHGYPIRMKEVVIFNAGTIMRAIIKLCKVFLTKKMQERIVLANSDDALFNLVNPNQLPLEGGHGHVEPSKVREQFAERMRQFAELEKSFTLDL